MKVKFRSLSPKLEVMRNQKKRSREKAEIMKTFGKVHINLDSPVLVRKEEKRLCDKIRLLKLSASSTDRIYIRRGNLYHNNEIIDSIDITSQLF